MKCWGCKTKLDLLTSIRIHLGDENNTLCSKCKVWGAGKSSDESERKPISNSRRLCQSCKIEYQLNTGDPSQCPNCGSIYWTLVQDPEKSSNFTSSGPSQLLNVVDVEINDFDRLIAAQNRTTHAIRAFVRFLFIQLTGITLAVLLWNLSMFSIDEQSCRLRQTNCDGNPFLQLMAVAVYVTSVVLSSRAGWVELEKSNIE